MVVSPSPAPTGARPKTTPPGPPSRRSQAPPSRLSQTSKPSLPSAADTDTASTEAATPHPTGGGYLRATSPERAGTNSTGGATASAPVVIPSPPPSCRFCLQVHMQPPARLMAGQDPLEFSCESATARVEAFILAALRQIQQHPAAFSDAAASAAELPRFSLDACGTVSNISGGGIHSVHGNTGATAAAATGRTIKEDNHQQQRRQAAGPESHMVRLCGTFASDMDGNRAAKVLYSLISSGEVGVAMLAGRHSPALRPEAAAAASCSFPARGYSVNTRGFVQSGPPTCLFNASNTVTCVVQEGDPRQERGPPQRRSAMSIPKAAILRHDGDEAATRRMPLAPPPPPPPVSSPPGALRGSSNHQHAAAASCGVCVTVGVRAPAGEVSTVTPFPALDEQVCRQVAKRIELYMEGLASGFNSLSKSASVSPAKQLSAAPSLDGAVRQRFSLASCDASSLRVCGAYDTRPEVISHVVRRFDQGFLEQLVRLPLFAPCGSRQLVGYTFSASVTAPDGGKSCIGFFEERRRCVAAVSPPVAVPSPPPPPPPIAPAVRASPPAVGSSPIQPPAAVAMSMKSALVPAVTLSVKLQISYEESKMCTSEGVNRTMSTELNDGSVAVALNRGGVITTWSQSVCTKSAVIFYTPLANTETFNKISQLLQCAQLGGTMRALCGSLNLSFQGPILMFAIGNATLTSCPCTIPPPPPAPPPPSPTPPTPPALVTSIDMQQAQVRLTPNATVDPVNVTVNTTTFLRNLTCFPLNASTTNLSNPNCDTKRVTGFTMRVNSTDFFKKLVTRVFFRALSNDKAAQVSPSAWDKPGMLELSNSTLDFFPGGFTFDNLGSWAQRGRGKLCFDVDRARLRELCMGASCNVTVQYAPSSCIASAAVFIPAV